MLPSIILLTSTWLVTAATTKTPTISNSIQEIDIGPIYDCSTRSSNGMYDAPEPPLCSKNTTSHSKITKGNVLEYKPDKINITMWRCEYYILREECKEGFFAQKEKLATKNDKITNTNSCKRAAILHISPLGQRLYQISPHVWKTRDDTSFECDWMRIDVKKTLGYRIEDYDAFARAGDSMFHQMITETPCPIDEISCHPSENPLQIIVHNLPKETTLKEYKNWGQHDVYIYSFMASIPSIGAGGIITKRTDESISISTGWIITFEQITTSTLKRDMAELHQELIDSNTDRSDSVQAERLAGVVTEMNIEIERANSHTNKLLCKAITDIHHIKQLLINKIPGGGSSLLSSDHGTYTEVRGEGILVSRCKQIPKNSYKILYGRSIRNKDNSISCFDNIPIQTSHKEIPKISFLNIQDHTIDDIGIRRNCSANPPMLIIKDINQQFYKLSHKGRITPIQPKEIKTVVLNEKYLPRFKAFNSKYLHTRKTRLNQISTMRAMSDSADAVNIISSLNQDNIKNLERMSQDSYLEDIADQPIKAIAMLKDAVKEEIKRVVLIFTITITIICITILISCYCFCKHKSKLNTNTNGPPIQAAAYHIIESANVSQAHHQKI